MGLSKIEFNYKGEWYRYDNSWIIKRGSFDTYFEKICQIPKIITTLLPDLATIQQKAVLSGILDTWYKGKQAGKEDHIKEFKKLFDIPNRY